MMNKTYTAKDLNEHLKNKSEEKQKAVDSWLRDVVFPKFESNNQGFEVYLSKLKMSQSEFKELLEQRGFLVETSSSYQGFFVFISIPPQGD